MIEKGESEGKIMVYTYNTVNHIIFTVLLFSRVSQVA